MFHKGPHRFPTVPYLAGMLVFGTPLVLAVSYGAFIAASSLSNDGLPAVRDTVVGWVGVVIAGFGACVLSERVVMPMVTGETARRTTGHWLVSLLVAGVVASAAYLFMDFLWRLGELLDGVYPLA